MSGKLEEMLFVKDIVLVQFNTISDKKIHIKFSKVIDEIYFDSQLTYVDDNSPDVLNKVKMGDNMNCI